MLVCLSVKGSCNSNVDVNESSLVICVILLFLVNQKVLSLSYEATVLINSLIFVVLLLFSAYLIW